MNPYRWRRTRKAALIKYQDIECPLCIESYEQPRHAARMNLVTKSLEDISESLYVSAGLALPGRGKHRRVL